MSEMQEVRIEKNILKLVDYALATRLIDPLDTTFTINRLLELFALDEIDDQLVTEWEASTHMTQEQAEAQADAIWQAEAPSGVDIETLAVAVEELAAIIAEL